MYSIKELEKMVKEASEKNCYELYRRACCLLHLHIKVCPESEEKIACGVLFDALSNEKSEGFLNTAREIVKNKHSSNDDVMVYALLLSVRIHDVPIIACLLKICDDIQIEVLNKLAEGDKSEKRE